MNIEQACEAFRVLLEEQQNRIANMNTEKTDFTTKKCVQNHPTNSSHERHSYTNRLNSSKYGRYRISDCRGG